jgi:D-glycero-alpha-D-manno-heptose-7-phosphate kinase
MTTILATAPVRICDCGGWSDTWFAGHGRVFNVAVSPGAEVTVAARPRAPGLPPVLLDVRDFGDRYTPRLAAGQWERHPLLEAAIVHVGVPDGRSLEIGVRCDAPPGASMGTSAAVTVALVGALMHLRDGHVDAREVSRAAHDVETVRLGQQCGIQDQICCAMGGINDIEMTSYPEAEIRQVPVTAPVRDELQRRLVVVFLGRGHRSSDVHQRVIERIVAGGRESGELDDIRACAAQASQAAARGDLDALGAAMSANTAAQRRLHPDLVSSEAERVMAVARGHGAAGWKVNGAGGDGGTLTILGPGEPRALAAMIDAVRSAGERFTILPVRLSSTGLRIRAR